MVNGARRQLVAAIAAMLAAGIVLLGWSTLPARAQDTGSVRFTIVDHLSPDQVEEVITVYIGARNVGTLHVDAARPEDRIQVTVPAAERYDYSLCGKLRVRDRGAVIDREINDGGTLTDVEGRTFAAYTEGAAAFYLLDVTPGRRAAEVRRDRAQRCAAAVASR